MTTSYVYVYPTAFSQGVTDNITGNFSLSTVRISKGLRHTKGTVGRRGGGLTYTLRWSTAKLLSLDFTKWGHFHQRDAALPVGDHQKTQRRDAVLPVGNHQKAQQRQQTTAAATIKRASSFLEKRRKDKKTKSQQQGNKRQVR